MMQTLRLIVTMACLWLLLSGFFKTQMLVLGGISVILVVALASRMRVLELSLIHISEPTRPY